MGCFLFNSIDWGKVAEIIATSIATLAAAYFGAKFAFDMQTRRESAKEMQLNIDSANVAMFTIRRFRQFFEALKSSIENDVDPFLQHHLLLKPFSTVNWEYPQFSYDSLAFLLKGNESVLFNLAALQNDISSTLDITKQRSDMHYSIVQPAIERIQNEKNGVGVPSDLAIILADKLGPRIDATMENLTEEMKSGIASVIDRCTIVANQIATALETSYPGKVKKRKWSAGSST
ncbi:hypothetical protein [Lysobacter soyae]|uniref:Uncharacterized protein n=1 Tax=Lysobacter soyae TaxID=2764185 RepID=A0ABX8WNY2_9GAMM|nr:hypothetical protein [Lysobacter sp. CJ11]QYR52952.1 hypothetical protein H8L67_00020 [Lysobacter sp. CJ11]